ncbi:polysaccharide biosynthesis/export family protein [Bacteroidales bacterium OttesenSCG-928-M11]|nr:polysaccharide biosynthesis/export family protein [Bacteroidales bacterium OttesenSCG-928-M11]
MKSKSNIYLIFFLLLPFLFSSCITNKQKVYLQKEGENKTYKVTPFEEYKLCINDEIIYYLMSTNEDTQYLYNAGSTGVSSQQRGSVYRIYEDGCVVLPTIGKVYLVGLTLREAERELTKKFQGLVGDAEIKIAMSNNYFYVLGDNGKGQFYAYKENLNIFQALAMAGDITTTGSKDNIKIIRRGNDGLDHVQTIDLRKESIVESEFYYIYPNDVIYIPTNPNSFFRVDSFSGFVALILTPLSLLTLSISLLK